MNRKEHTQRRTNFMNRLMKWPVLCGLSGLVMAQAAVAADAFYINNAIIEYPGNVVSPPQVDATNFVNDGTFIINFTSLGFPQPLYETSDTINYTNSGNAVMAANTGFQFDTQSSSTGAHSMAGSFYNAGSIFCDTTNDAGNLFAGFNGFFGEFYATATNIVNPGAVSVGINGIIQFTGYNVNLSSSSLTIQGGGANVFGNGTFGTYTNWDPSANLGPTEAISAFFPINPGFLVLPNSTPYINVASTGPSNNVIRSVFIEDTSISNTSESVSYNVYFDSGGNGLGGGNVTIEWVGSYLDVATGDFLTNYLYLNNDYALGASTNVALTAGGVPDNLTFTESPVRLPTGSPPAPSGFVNVFPAGGLTNFYSFGNLQLAATSFSTSSIPNLALTNLPGRVEISASNELNLASAQIVGPNYLSVLSTNQFDGSPGASIEAPYSDLNLGVTNGFLTLSNLLVPQTPIWGGTIQAWDTRWLEVDPTTGITNDYRVLIVGSQLTPTILAQVHNLVLHSTNSIIISDTFNVMNSFSADAQNLTLTTNGTALGATSLDGEINLDSPNIFWSTSLPNLRNLTNNGAMRFQNLAQFLASSNNVAITTNIPAVAAFGTLSEVSGRTNVHSGNLLVIGTNEYRFVTKITNAVPNQVAIATKFDGTLSNLIAAINGATGSGTKYSSSTIPNAQVAAESLTNHAFIVTAQVAGTNGNSIQTANSTTSTNLTWATPFLSGGVADVPGATNITGTTTEPYFNFINTGLLSDQGSTIWADNFLNSGDIFSGVGSFALQALTTTLTNGSIVTGGSVSIATSTLLTGGVGISAGTALSLTVTNDIGDSGATNGNLWSVGSANGGLGVVPGLSLPIKPVTGDLLFTTITNIATSGTQVNVVWAGQDRGAVNAGFSNNAAIGQFMADALGTVPASGGRTLFNFSGPGTNNAIYVDNLVLLDNATNFDLSGNVSAFTFSPNLVIYYAEALDNGISVAEKLDHKNNDHLRWVPTYAGIFSSTNLVYPAGVTNVVNAALAGSPDIDSDGNGVANAYDPTPFLVPAQLNFTLSMTNMPAATARLQWLTVAGGTNFVYYSTNLVSPTWQTLTNFNSPQPVPSPAANVSVFDPVGKTPRYYKVVVNPNLISF